MKTIRETIIAGMTNLRSIRISSGAHFGSRKPKMRITPEKVRKNNMRCAVRRLTALLNANFSGSGAHVTLTYGGDPPEKKQAAADRRNFIRRLRRSLAQCGVDLKYVVVTEYENHRIHHHIVMNCQDIPILNECWPKGYVKMTALSEEGDYSKLAEYLIKETEKTFRLPDSAHKQRYSASRNLIQPVIKRESVDARLLDEDPVPTKGYYIPKDRIRRYEHPITGIEYLEWIEIAYSEETRLKRNVWPRGETVPWREVFRANEFEVQEEFDWGGEAP